MNVQPLQNHCFLLPQIHYLAQLLMTRHFQRAKHPFADRSLNSPGSRCMIYCLQQTLTPARCTAVPYSSLPNCCLRQAGIHWRYLLRLNSPHPSALASCFLHRDPSGLYSQNLDSLADIASYCRQGRASSCSLSPSYPA